MRWNLGQGIHEAAKQAEVGRGARPGLANKIMIVFTDGWQNKGPVGISIVYIVVNLRQTL
jgi:hypothetical protein